MKKLLALALAVNAGLALARDNSYPVYINANLGTSTALSPKNNQDIKAFNSNFNYSNSLALGANAGYNFNRFFGIEGGLTHVWVNNYINDTMGILDVAVKGSIPLGKIFSIYGRAGLAGYSYYATTPKSGVPSGTSVGLLYGVGASWNLSRHWSLRAEDWSVTGIPSVGQIVQFGAQLSF